MILRFPAFVRKTIYFNNQLLCRAIEIGDKRTDRLLPTESYAF